MLKRKLDIGTVETLFDSDSEVEATPKKEQEFMSDEDDKFLIRAYDEIQSEIKKFKSEKVKSSESQSNELEDGNDDLLNEAIDAYEKKSKRQSLVPKNMLHLVQNTKKEIKRNAVMARIRLRENSITWMTTFKKKMSDYFFPIESWPTYALEILLTRDFSYHERIGLACFMHGNGLRDPDKALCIFQMYNKHWSWNREWTPQLRKFQFLFQYLDQTDKNTEEGDRIRNEYWYFDLNLKQTLFYDGHVRTSNGEKRKYYPLFIKKK